MSSFPFRFIGFFVAESATAGAGHGQAKKVDRAFQAERPVFYELLR